MNEEYPTEEEIKAHFKARDKEKIRQHIFRYGVHVILCPICWGDGCINKKQCKECKGAGVL